MAGLVVWLAGRGPKASTGAAPDRQGNQAVRPSKGGARPERPAKVGRVALQSPAQEGVEPPEGIRIRVVDDETNEGIAGVRVRARSETGGFQRWKGLGIATTAEDGRCRLSGEPIENATLLVELSPPPGWAHQIWRGDVPEQELVIALTSGGALRGTVRLSDGSLPPEESDLELTWHDEQGREGSTRCDVVEGLFESAPVLAGRVIFARLFRPNPDRELDLNLGVGGPAIEPGETTETSLVFDIGCTCRFRVVVEGNGEPLAGAEVRIASTRGHTTDAKGEIHVPGALPAGVEGLIGIEHPDVAPWVGRIACPDPPIEIQRTIEVERGCELSGVVVDAADRPLPGLNVQCVRYVPVLGAGSRAVRMKKETATDDRGRFVLRGLPDADDLVLAFLENGSVLGVQRLSTPEDCGREVWRVSDPVSIRGRVIDHEGSPVVGREVSAVALLGFGGAASQTDEHGRFELRGLPPALYRVSTDYEVPGPPGMGPDPIRRRIAVDVDTGPSGAGGVTLRLEPPRETPLQIVEARLRCFDAATSQRIERIDSVQAELLDSYRSWFRFANEQPPAGLAFHLPEGEYRFLVQSAGYVPGEAHARLEPGHGPVRVDLVLDPE